ncbi:response regulator transcription factor [Chryseobacterium fluminis]|uniref:response regulator n=1 Tax=Chryseobacterium fluminis TaxID=2983606 RepID=UPI00225712E2|nr:response regulator transcription factor [Chryseobacterium sp. MMS21-Ot14]UZT96520.1 response regulator transcription factor [Chryseobacterium sp. MMS21-Ot14]
MEGKKIMICDDDPGILEVLEMILEIEGYTVYTESNSTNLIKEISQTLPDLLLMDLWMPVLSGDQLLRTIRGTKELEHLPVIILSASVDGNEIASNAGADGFIAKPFDMDEVSVKIQNVLSDIRQVN